MKIFGQKRPIRQLLDSFLTNQKGQVTGVELQSLGADPTYFAQLSLDANGNYLGLLDEFGNPISGFIGNTAGVNPPTGMVGEYLASSTPGTTATVTINISTPAAATITDAAHGLAAGSAVTFTTTGALPTGLTAGTTYYILATGLAVNGYQVSATPFGTAVITSGTQSGVQTRTSSANLSTGAAKNIHTMFLQPGTYDASGVALYHSASGTTVPADVKQGFSLVSATFGALGTWSYDYVGIALAATDDPAYVTPVDRILVPAGGAVLYLIAQSDFSVSTLTAYGQLRATRVY